MTAPVVAEHAFALMLATAKRIAFQTAEMKSGRWTRMENIYLHLGNDEDTARGMELSLTAGIER